MDKASEHHIHMEDLLPMNHHVGSMHQVFDAQPERPIMDGQFTFQYHNQGLSLHCVQAEELQTISHSLELKPGLSFNIVFLGRIDFSLAGQRYYLGGENHQAVECSAITITQPEILTRHMQAGRQVRKVNVYVERSWFEQHCKTPSQLKQLNTLFQQHTTLRKWTPSQRLINRANVFYRFREDDDMTTQLEHEYKTIRLLSACIEELLTYLKLEQPNDEQYKLPNQSEQKLKERIDAQLTECYSLDKIAESMGLSVSTLQRKFKESYQMTVIDYIRQRRLELAKAALTLDGISIGEAAYMAGYKHPSNFVSAFKKRFSITPSNLVKCHQLKRRSTEY